RVAARVARDARAQHLRPRDRPAVHKSAVPRPEVLDHEPSPRAGDASVVARDLGVLAERALTGLLPADPELVVDPDLGAVGVARRDPETQAVPRGSGLGGLG